MSNRLRKSRENLLAHWSDEMLEKRLSTVYRMLATADAKAIPALNRSIERLFTEQVRRDMESRH
mgnify:CR=1 FL=1